MPTIQMGEDISQYYSDPITQSVTIEYFADDYNNDESCGNLLTQLHKDLERLDFPYFFVELVTTNKDIEQELVVLHKIYSNEQQPLHYTLVEGDFKKNIYKGESMCIMPWIHKYVNPQGLVMPCCVADENYPLGNIKHSDLQDISTEKIQKQMIAGQRPDACRTCWYKEDNGLPSFRQMANKKHAKWKDQTDFVLRHLDIRLSNKCNLMCRMCSGKFSNRIAQEEQKIYGFTKYKNEILDNQHVDKQLDYIEQNIDNLDDLYFAGGEPLINQTHYDILKLLIKHGKTDVRIDYNTNFSMLKFKNHNILDYWKHFDSIGVGASIDLLGEQSSYVRHGVDYSVLEENYKCIKDLQNISFTIASTLSIFNVFNLPQLQKRWLDLGLDCNSIDFQTLVNPKEQSIAVLPYDYKQKAEDTILSHIQYLEYVSNSQSLIRRWQQSLEFMKNVDDTHLLSEFFRLNDDKDRSRSQTFEEYFPEYKDLRNYA